MSWWGWLVIGANTPHLRDDRIDGFLSRILCRRRRHLGSAGPLGGERPHLRAVVALRIAVHRTLVLFRARLRKKIKTREHDVDKLEEEIAVATEPIAAGATGQAELWGSTWSARNTGEMNLHVGDRCRVERVDGLVLSIRKNL